MAFIEAASSNLSDKQEKQETKRLMYKLLKCLPTGINFTLDEEIRFCNCLNNKEKQLAQELVIQIQNLLYKNGYVEYFEPNNTYQLFTTKSKKND